MKSGYNARMMSVGNSTETRNLLSKATADDPQTFLRLFDRHRKRLQRMVRLRLDRRLRERIRSNDVLELVRRNANQRIGEYHAQPDGSFFLWLRSLAGEQIRSLHEQYLDHSLADAGDEITIYRGALPEVNSVSLAAQLLGHMTCIGEEAARIEAQVRLQDALNSMEQLDREVLTLCHFEELSNAEAAEALGIDKATASKHYIRALKRLKEILNSIPGLLKKNRG